MARPLIEVNAIYQAALQLTSEQGSQQLTIRNLTQALNCSPNTIYSQVGDREALIQGMLDHFFQAHAVCLPDDIGWFEQCKYWALDFHGLLVSNSDLARLMSLRQRPAIADRANALLEKLLSSDFSPEFALRCVRVLSNQTIALSLLEIESPPAGERRRGRSAGESRLEKSVQTVRENDRFSGVESAVFQEQSEIFESAIEFTLRGIESAYRESQAVSAADNVAGKDWG